MAVENDQDMTEPRHRFTQLENNELAIGTSLSAAEYAELLLGYLIQQNSIKAKFCYMRAMEKFGNDNLLKQIWIFGEHIYKRNLGRALHICNKAVLAEPSLQHYIDELKHRLTASQLFSIANSYSSISTSKFAQVLGLEDSTILQELIQKCCWTVTDDGFIFPAKTDELMQTIAELNDPKFGTKEIKAQPKQMTDGQETEKSRNLSSLSSLIDSSIFFDAMALPTKANSTSTNGSNNPNN